MVHRRIKQGLGIIGGLACLIVAFVMGLYIYVAATTKPIHPDAKAITTVTSSAPAAKWTAAVEQAQQRARAGLMEQNLPGLSVAVGVGGELIWAEGFGWADMEQKVPATPETRFRAGEVSIPLTSAGVGVLLEKSKLALDDEIQIYVPEFPKKPWPVTLRQLMSHVAGVPSDQGDEAPLANANDDGPQSRSCQRVVDGFDMDNFAKRDLRFEPGTEFAPSTYGWVVVSAAVEAAAEEPFFAFMRTRVFEPLGMRDTTVDIATEPIPDRAKFYFPRFAADTKYGPQDARHGDHSCYAGAGAFLSTPSDLVRFGMAITRGKLLQPATVTLLQTQQRLASGEETGYGLGWKIETLPLAGEAATMAGHGTKADFIGTTAYLMTFPERGIVVAVMSNTSFGDAKAMASKVADAFYPFLVRSIRTRYR